MTESVTQEHTVSQTDPKYHGWLSRDSNVAMILTALSVAAAAAATEALNGVFAGRRVKIIGTREGELVKWECVEMLVKHVYKAQHGTRTVFTDADTLYSYELCQGYDVEFLDGSR